MYSLLDYKKLYDNNLRRAYYLADYASDIENLPTSTSRGAQTDDPNQTLDTYARCAAGSECLVAEDGTIYTLNNSDEWIEAPERKATYFYNYLYN